MPVKPVNALRGKSPARLMISESENSADMLHATRFRAPDPFVYLEVGGRSSILLSDLEFDRGWAEAQVNEVVSSSDVEKSIVSKAPPP